MYLIVDFYIFLWFNRYLLVIKGELIMNDNKQTIKFSIGGEPMEKVYEAVEIHPERWNGWACPIVTIEVAEQIANDLYELNKEFEYYEDDEYCPSVDVRQAIQEAKENHEETVDVGCGLIWLELEQS